MIFLLHCPSPRPLSVHYFLCFIGLRLSILFSVVLSSSNLPCPWCIHPRHFIRYVFIFSPHRFYSPGLDTGRMNQYSRTHPAKQKKNCIVFKAANTVFQTDSIHGPVLCCCAPCPTYSGLLKCKNLSDLSNKSKNVIKQTGYFFAN